MANAPNLETGDRSEASAHIPLMQRVLDNPFLLLFLGVTIPAVFYLMWGLIELTHMPIAK